MTKEMPPDPPVSWFTVLSWRIWARLTWWPWQVRELKRAGFRRTGWCKWEAP